MYYYNTETGKDYEQTLKDVWAYAAQEGIPYRNILLDSWWYYKGVNDGVKEWLPMPSIFPDGMTAVTNFTGPPIAHNRYWASDNVYAKQNGGQWDWLIEGDISLPLTQGFWDWLMESSRNWGLRTYEQVRVGAPRQCPRLWLGLPPAYATGTALVIVAGAVAVGLVIVLVLVFLVAGDGLTVRVSTPRGVTCLCVRELTVCVWLRMRVCKRRRTGWTRW